VNEKIIYRTEADFVNYLEYSAIKRLVIALAFQSDQGRWQALFIQRVWMDDEQVGIETTKGKRYSLDELYAIIPSFDHYEQDALSCLCS